MALCSLDSGQGGRAGESKRGSHFFLLARVSGCYPRPQGQDHRRSGNWEQDSYAGGDRSVLQIDQFWPAQGVHLGHPVSYHASVSPAENEGLPGAL